MNELKMVIVMRKDLNMRKGKMIAQGGHAVATVIKKEFDRMYGAIESRSTAAFERYGAFRSWLDGLQTKICVGTDSEQQLLEIHQKAVASGLPCSLILDAGKTEFKEPTYTAVAIGPGLPNDVDPITGALKLL